MAANTRQQLSAIQRLASDPRRQAYFEQRLLGKSKVDSARAAGFSEAVCKKPGSRIENADVKAAFREVMAVACDPVKLAIRVQEGLDAEETKFFQHEGTVTDERNVVNFSERREYVKLAAQYGGYVEEKAGVAIGIALGTLEVVDL